MKPIQFCTRGQGLEIIAERNRSRYAFDVSGYAPLPFRALSPFFYWKEYGRMIKVPGQDAKAYSVESIWQGLKIIDGKTDTEMFLEKPHKRKSEKGYAAIEGFVIGEKIVTDYAKARKELFAPAYTGMFNSLKNHDLFVQNASLAISMNAAKDIEIFLFDVDDNPNIDDTSRPYSHAELLRDIINRECKY